MTPAANQPAYLAVDQYENTLTLLSPGSSVITSNGSTNPVLWILVGNVLRSDSLLSPNCSHPILYALDPLTMKVLWQSTPSQLNVGGKYNTPAIAKGVVFVGTDRIQAFGINSAPPHPTGISIDSCGPATGIFVADTDINGGHCNTFTQAVDTTGVTNPAPQAEYQSKRTGAQGGGQAVCAEPQRQRSDRHPMDLRNCREPTGERRRGAALVRSFRTCDTERCAPLYEALASFSYLGCSRVYCTNG